MIGHLVVYIIWFSFLSDRENVFETRFHKFGTLLNRTMRKIVTFKGVRTRTVLSPVTKKTKNYKMIRFTSRIVSFTRVKEDIVFYVFDLMNILLTLLKSVK